MADFPSCYSKITFYKFGDFDPDHFGFFHRMDDPTESKILQDAIAVHIRIFLKFTSKALSSEKVNQNYSKYSVFLSAEFIFAILAFFILVFFRKQMQTLHDIFGKFIPGLFLFIYLILFFQTFCGKKLL